MPDHIIEVGNDLTADDLNALPIGAVITDDSGEEMTRRHDGWSTDDNSASIADVKKYAAAWNPRLVSLPGLAQSIGHTTPDLFQEARIALRDRLGTEPSDDLVEGTQRLMQSGNVDAQEAAHLVAGAQSLFTAPAPLADTFVLVVVHGSDAATRLIVSADTTAGLARLRAHAALDALLDQHGISR